MNIFTEHNSDIQYSNLLLPMDYLKNDAHNAPRTYKNIEGNNKKLKNYVSAASPHTYQSVCLRKRS